MYAVEILRRFDVLDCKVMDTNLKLLYDESSELVDVTQYKHIIGSLMYLTNTRPYIFFVVNTLSQYPVKPCSPDSYKASDEVPKRYGRLGTLLW